MYSDVVDYFKKVKYGIYMFYVDFIWIGCENICSLYLIFLYEFNVESILVFFGYLNYNCKNIEIFINI